MCQHERHGGTPGAGKGRLQDHLPERQDLHLHGLTDTALYFGSPNKAETAAELTPEQRRDLTIRREIIWESAEATDVEVRAMEMRLIRENRANDPAVGYNQLPKHWIIAQGGPRIALAVGLPVLVRALPICTQPGFPRVA